MPEVHKTSCVPLIGISGMYVYVNVLVDIPGDIKGPCYISVVNRTIDRTAAKLDNLHR